MKNLLCYFLAPIFMACAFVGQCSADDFENNWPRWRGPLVTGVAPNGNPPTKWDDSTNIKWKVEIPGLGSGSPIVWGDKIFFITAIETDRTELSTEETAEVGSRTATRLVSNTEIEDTPSAEAERPRGPRGERRGGRGGRGGFGGFGRGAQPTNVHQFVVLCLDRNSGDVIWEKIATEAIPHEGHHGTASFASSTPVTDGENLYVSFGSRGIYSYDFDGNLRWKRDLGQMQTRHSFGEGASPALHEDTLVIPWDHEGDSYIIALDANTGETKWQKPRDEVSTWATPLIVEHDGTVQVITNGTERVRSYDLSTGELIWECGGQAQNPIATPAVLGDLVFCMTGHRGSALYAIPLDAKGDITDTDEIAWTLSQNTPYVPSPLLYEGLLYYLKSNNAILTCVDAETGEIQYEAKRLPDVDVVYASPVAADGRIYISGRNGATVVLKAGPEYEVLTTNQLEETIDATPAIVGNVMYLRGQRHVYAIAED